MLKGESGKVLSPGQHEELLLVLEARFEKNMNRHPGLVWAEVKARLRTNTDKLWSLNEMERTGGNRMSSVIMKLRANTFFMIVHLKVLLAAEMFVMTVRHWSQEKSINQKIPLRAWQGNGD